MKIVDPRKPVIGVMGPGESAYESLKNHAEQIGRIVAENNWILLTGGRNAGVMDAASKGAFLAGGEVIGILPDDHKMSMSKFVTRPILTGMGSGRNIINILTSDVVIICGMGPGTSSEAALAIKHGKPVLFTRVPDTALTHFSEFITGKVQSSNDLTELADLIRKSIQRKEI